jgi:hypothetical protein
MVGEIRPGEKRYSNQSDGYPKRRRIKQLGELDRKSNETDRKQPSDK